MLSAFTSGLRFRDLLLVITLVSFPPVATLAAVDFALVGAYGAAPFVVESDTDPAVARAVADLRADIERVTSRAPEKLAAVPVQAPAVVIVGVAGQSAVLERLRAAGTIDLQPLTGSWETFVVAVVDQPLPGVEQALVVAGSDRRGAIYGLYEISNLIGVSPWTWWADVRVPRQNELKIPAGTRVVGPPSVKYRGIFINDEDWGLLPWAAKTFEPETGNLGPKTYAKIFELVLRLRGNLVWPGMHPTTTAFNFVPGNKEVADAYGIVMGSSHAEPMLRNNVGEWKADPHDYNYVTNRDGVLRYWEERVAANGRYENIYTVGMRGIQDSLMLGPKTDTERVQTLEKIFADQRALLAKYVRPDVEQVPQMFCAYKEVLELYRLGLKVPDDVTIVWPDDNFGYIRGLPTDAERARKGGSGVYYHISYLGRPLSYLWLATTPPALIWQQMHQAYEHGADRIWVANVGDIKPGEIATEFFLQMAWDAKRWTPENLPQFLEQWAAREFGPEHAKDIAALMDRYYQLNFRRKPEHLQWWLGKEPRRPSDLTDEEVVVRVAEFAHLRRRSEAMQAALPAESRDAYYQLVHYPIVGSALANLRYFCGETGRSEGAATADRALTAETKVFNEQIAGGKWNGIMTLEPADTQWASMRIAPWEPFAAARTPVPTSKNTITLGAGQFTRKIASAEASWTVIPGLGRVSAVTVLPSTTPRYEGSAIAQAPQLEYEVPVPNAGDHTVELHLLPTFPLTGKALRLAIAVDAGAPQEVTLDVTDGRAWSDGVLNNSRSVAVPISFATPGKHVLRVYGTDAGVVLDRIVFVFNRRFGP